MIATPYRLFLSCLVLILFSASIPSAAAAPAATTTTFTITSGGSAVTSVNSGSVVTFTATVSAGATNVTVGQVKFCDASASYCLDTHLLGTAQLTLTGTAVIKLLPPPGSHSYKAVFVGTKTMATSVSAVATLTVTGPFPSATTAASSGQVGNYSLAAIVTGSDTAAAPTGTISLLNASANNNVIASRSLPAPSGSVTPCCYPTEYFSNTGLSFALLWPAVAGDFNGDGFLDIAGTADSNGGSNAGVVLLGDGQGHFKTAANSLSQYSVGPNTAVGDFNADGALDLVVDGQVLLGNGDGTFKQGQTLSVSGFPVVADFNGDGIPDIAFLNTSQGLVLVDLGNGDGTFTASSLAPPLTGANAVAMVAGDFNGDGIADLAVTDTTGNTVEVFLSNGDGSFTAQAPISLTANAQFPTAGAIVTGDFNEDGNLDLAAVNGNGSVEILLGDGHGNFSAGSNIAVGGQGATEIGGTIYLATGDFNGDGNTDLIASVLVADELPQSGGMGAIAFGNGDGTFAAFNFLTDPGIAAISVVGDFNADGVTDILDEEGAFMSIRQSVNATFSGVSLTPGSGTQQVVASYAGDANYAASTSAPIALQAAQGTPAVVVTATSASITEGWPLTVTVTGGGLVPTGSVIVYDGSALLGTFTLNNAGVATVFATTLALGANSITAVYSGDTNYVAVTSAPLMLTVTAPGATASTVAVKPASSTVIAGQALSVSVTVAGPSGSANPTGSVNLSSGSYSAWQSLTGGAATFSVPAGVFSSGSNTLTASYPGDPTYAASKATATVTVSPIAAAIPAPSAIAAGASATATVTFTASSTYQGTLNLSCALTTSPSGAQSLPTCALNPASVALQASGTGTSMLTVKTTASSTATLGERPRANWWKACGGGTVLALVFVCGIPARRRRWVSILSLLSIFAVTVAIGCGGGSSSGGSGGGSSGTTAGNYVFTVTGTDTSNASITASATVTVTVQ